MSTTPWDQFARERHEALIWADKHPGAYPKTKDEILREDFSPDYPDNEENEDNDE